MNSNADVKLTKRSKKFNLAKSCVVDPLTFLIPPLNLTMFTKYDSNIEFAAVPKTAMSTVKTNIPYPQGVDKDGEV